MATVWSILIRIDGAIYDLICYVYEIFYYLATLNIFSESDYINIVYRIYVILGVFMLFILSYSLLRAIINPEEFSKGENSFPNLIKNVVISLVIIVLLPTAFTVIFNIQNSLLNNQTIERVILGSDNTELESNVESGRIIAYNLFKAFLYPNPDYCASEEYDDIDACRETIRGNGWIFVTNGEELTVMDQAVLEGASFTNYNDYSESIRDGELSYLFPISTVAGIFALYVLLNFCFDMAVRVIKLAFYQIIAPIPVICRILPGGKMKDVFDKWVKQITSIILEVFIRIGVLALGVYLIRLIISTYENGLPGIGTLSFGQPTIVLALLIMGVIIFIRQAPKLLGDLLNLDTGGMKLGLKEKLAMGGGLIAGAAAGGALTQGVRNFTGAFAGKEIVKDIKNRNFGSAFKKAGTSILPGVRSAVGGAGSAAVRAGFNARGAQNFRDVRDASRRGIEGAAARKSKRDLYKANHQHETVLGQDVSSIPFVGGIVGGTLGAAVGHVKDLAGTGIEYIGVGSTYDDLKAQESQINYVSSAVSGVKDEAKNLVLSDASKNENKSYGITAQYTTSSAAVQGILGRFNSAAAGFNITGRGTKYSTKTLRQIQQAKAAAQSSGQPQFGLTLAEWEDLENDYTNEFVNKVANQGLLSKANLASLASSNSDAYNDLKDVIIAGQKMRGAIQDSMIDSYVENAGIDSSFIDDNHDIDINSGQIKALKKNLKNEGTSVGIALAQKRNEEKQKNPNGGNN